MKETSCISNGVPTAHVCINKSRLKIYHKEKSPTYYLAKGTEFQLELYNPTSDKILAKIFLNGKPIAQGGLVLRPAERVHLDRYIDVAKKFLFDIYEVTNTEQNRQAIEDNGDFKVEFYKEQHQLPYQYYGNYYGSYYQQIDFVNYPYTNTCNSTNTYQASVNSLNFSPDNDTYNHKRCLSKKIETGIVEKGSDSNQKLDTVCLNWESWAFHTIEYKMLPLSQKVNAVEDLKVKRYCVNCGHILKAEFKYCPACATKV